MLRRYPKRRVLSLDRAGTQEPIGLRQTATGRGRRGRGHDRDDLRVLDDGGDPGTRKPDRVSARRDLLGLDGFCGIERFESVSEPGKFVAIGFFRDEDAVKAWRNTPEHRRAQALGRARLFAGYRLRMAEVTRDYGPAERGQAPTDSQLFHHRKDTGNG
jgi:heme-degrading monooxygenase HmoA